MGKQHEIGLRLVVTEQGVAVLDDSGKKVKQLGDKAEKTTGSLKGMSAGSVALGTALGQLAAQGIGAALRGLGRLASVGGEWISLSQEQARATQGLQAALEKQGIASAETMAHLQGMADELQNLTGIGDETSERLAAVALNMGATTEQAALLVPAAADMAAAMGIDIEQAARQATKTLGGFAGELGEVLPEMKALTAEELKAGKGIELLAEKFKGQAVNAMDAYTLATTKAKASIGDLGEKGGDVLTAVITPLAEELSKAASQMDAFIEANKPELVSKMANVAGVLVDAMAGLIKVGATAVEAYGAVRVAFAELLEVLIPVAKATALLTGAAGIPGVAKTLNELSAGLKLNVKDQKDFLARIVASAEGVKEFAGDIQGKLKKALADVGTEASSAAKAAKTFANAQANEAAPATQQAAEETEYLGAAIGSLADLYKEAGEGAINFGVTAVKALSRAVEATAEFKAEIESIKNAVFSFRVGKGEGKMLDLKGDDPKAAKIRGRVKDEGFLSGHVKEFQEAAASGDVAAMETIIKALRNQSAATEGIASPGMFEFRGKIAGLVQVMAQTLRALTNYSEADSPIDAPAPTPRDRSPRPTPGPTPDDGRRDSRGGGSVDLSKAERLLAQAVKLLDEINRRLMPGVTAIVYDAMSRNEG